MLTSKVSSKILVSLAAFNHACFLGVLSQDLSVAEICRYHRHHISLLGGLALSPEPTNRVMRWREKNRKQALDSFHLQVLFSARGK